MTPSILLVGDTHRGADALATAFGEAHEKGVDALIQLGDFGCGFGYMEDNMCDFCVFASHCSVTTGIPLYFIDGNHDNHEWLATLPIDPVTGLRPICEGVTHLPRGSTLELFGKRFRAFGGAYSVDKDYRKPGISWWDGEMVTEADLYKNQAAGPADIFLSHDIPYGLQNDANITRKLNGYFGPLAGERSLANQKRVRIALDDCGARYAFHGHLHHRYSDWLDNGTEHGVVVNGLGNDGHPGSTLLLKFDAQTHDLMAVEGARDSRDSLA